MKTIEATKPQQYVYSHIRPINAFIAGQGSGKTHSIGEIALALMGNYPTATGFIAANTYQQLTTSTLKGVKKVWREKGIVEYNKSTGVGHYTDGVIPPNSWPTDHHNLGNRYSNTIVFNNGALIFVGSLDNYKAHDGKELGWALLDETKDTKEEALKEVIIGRLRENTVPHNPLLIFTSPAKVPWVNRMFEIDDKHNEIAERLFSSENMWTHTDKEKSIVISSTHHNIKRVGQAYIDRLYKLHGQNGAKMFVHGFPFANEGGEIYHDFDIQEHVKPCTYEPNKAIWISLDFNVIPYMTILCAQIHNGRMHIFREGALKHPNNNSEAAGRWAKEQFIGHNAPIWVTGDPSGVARSTKQRAGVNDFTLFITGIKSKWAKVNIDRKAPPVAARTSLINYMLRNDLIQIDPSCNKTILDLVNVKQNPDGGKQKSKAKDANGNTYEPFGHMSDALDYAVCRIFNNQFKMYQNGKEPIFPRH